MPADGAGHLGSYYGEQCPKKRPNRPTYLRKRAVQACTTCRRRRSKCDNDRPLCSTCRRLGAQCVYEGNDKSRFDEASLAILHRLDDLEELFLTSSPDRLASHSIQHEPLPGSTSQTLGQIDQADTARFEICHINTEAVLEWPVLKSLSRDRPTELVRILRASPVFRPNLSTSSIPDLDQESAFELFDNFRANFYIFNPIFELTQIRSYIETSLQNGFRWDGPSCISLLVFALWKVTANYDYTSTTSTTIRDSKHFQDAESFFVAAQRRMGMLLCINDLSAAQVFFLAGVYLMSTMRPVEAWKLFSQALACSQALQAAATNPVNEDYQLCQRIHWTSFKSELELRLELSITDSTTWRLRYPQFFPPPPMCLQSDGEAGWYFYLGEIALRRLANRILAHTSHFGPSEAASSDRVSQVSDWEQQAQSWTKTLPRRLRLHNLSDQAVDSQTARLRFILNAHLVDCYEMMYWPFIVDAVHGTLPEDPDSILFARKGFQLSVQRIQDNYPEFRRRHHGTWLMLRSCTRSAFVLIAAVLGGREDLLPDNWKQTIEEVLELLQYWEDESNDFGFYSELLEAFI